MPLGRRPAGRALRGQGAARWVWYRYDDVRREEMRPGQPLAGAVEKAYLLAFEMDGEEAYVG